MFIICMLVKLNISSDIIISLFLFILFGEYIFVPDLFKMMEKTEEQNERKVKEERRKHTR